MISWQQSMTSGAVMMRPIMGPLSEGNYSIDELKEAKLEVYPNPNTTGNLSINMPTHFINGNQQDDFLIEIFNMYGQIVRSIIYKDQISIADLSKGMYIIRLSNTTNNNLLQSKLIIP